jgi:hypothetical protein
MRGSARRRAVGTAPEAHGLTPEEFRLMWATAPPRMPLTPEASALAQGEEDAAE